MNDNMFLSALYNRFGILPPDKYDQDWKYTAGKATQTEDYIDFYESEDLSPHQRDALINMILQGFDDLIAEGNDDDSLSVIWDRIESNLIKNRHMHIETIKYWSCSEAMSEDECFYVSKYIRELV